MDGPITHPHITPNLLPHPLLLPPPVHGWTDYTCSYYNKTFCQTPCCSSLLFTDRQITLAHISSRPSATPLTPAPRSPLMFVDGQIPRPHITPRPSATPPTALPFCSRTNRLHFQTFTRPSATPLTVPHSCSRMDRLNILILHQDLLPHSLLLLPLVHGWTDYTCSYLRYICGCGLNFSKG